MIPKGHPMGDPIKFDKEAGLLGDLYIHFNILDWNGFKLCRSNLYRKVTISLQEALFGFDKVLVTHMDGRQLKCNYPAARGVIKPGTFKRIPDEGMPKKGGRGDLFIEFDVDFPDRLEMPEPQSSNSPNAILTQLKSCFPDPVIMIEDGPVKACQLLDATADEVSVWTCKIKNVASSNNKQYSGLHQTRSNHSTHKNTPSKPHDNADHNNASSSSEQPTNKTRDCSIM